MDSRITRLLVLLTKIIGVAMLVATLGFLAFVAFAIYDYWDTERNRFSGEIREEGFEGAERTPEWSSDGKYIIANLGNSVYRVEFPGGEVRTVLNDEDTGYYSPSLSPDGRLAYNQYHPRSGENQIRILDADGKRSQTLAASGRSPSPLAWSPDGSRLLYRRFRDGEGYSAALHSEDSPDVALPVIDFLRSNHQVAWSYDSQYLATQYWMGPTADQDIILLTVRQDGAWSAVIDRVDVEGDTNISAPGWAANGELYYTKRDSREGETSIILYRAKPDGRDRQKVINLTAQPWAVTTSSAPRQTPPPGLDSIPHLRFDEVRQVQPSPDGKKVLLFADTSNEDNSSNGLNLYLWTGGDRTLVPLPIDYLGYNSYSPYSASWSPDGQWIAVCNLRLGLLYVVNSEGGGYRVLLTDDSDAWDLS